MSFLKAEWRKLVMANYIVDPKVLLPYVPEGTELDFYKDQCYISVVGFMFLNTKLLGMKIPFHIHFEEVNLRFYVRRKQGEETKRGVVFIKEIVPKPAITFVANTIYNENYETMPMNHKWEEAKGMINITYQWKKNKKWHKISVQAEHIMQEMQKDSAQEFIAEHYWGYAKHAKATTEYEVKHPTWQYYPVVHYQIDIDFLATYGKDFEFLNSEQPQSVYLLEGSEISVENKTEIKP